MDKMEVEESLEDNNNVKIGKDTFVGLGTRALKDVYESTKPLGKGGYGKVFQVRNKMTGKLYACKKLSKLNIKNLIKFRREVDILIKMDHPNIIKLYEVFESQNSLYLIMEECHGGELFDRILKRIENNMMYTEKEACEIILQVMGAIEYCHNKGVAHRDLKPENLLYLKEGSEENNPLKIIDFGLSRDINLKKLLSSKVGTAYYVSPEILAGQYNEKCDVWSAGVILYVLLSGEPPFNGPSDGVIYSKIKQLKFNFPEKKWKNISNEAKDLLSKMLLPEKDRLSASQVLLHPWFNLVKDNKIPLEKINFGLTNFFKEYKESNKLKKIVLLYIASKLQEDEILDLNNLFKAFDKDNNVFGAYATEELAKEAVKENDLLLYRDFDLNGGTILTQEGYNNIIIGENKVTGKDFLEVLEAAPDFIKESYDTNPTFRRAIDKLNDIADDGAVQFMTKVILMVYSFQGMYETLMNTITTINDSDTITAVNSCLISLLSDTGIKDLEETIASYNELSEFQKAEILNTIYSIRSNNEDGIITKERMAELLEEQDIELNT